MGLDGFSGFDGIPVAMMLACRSLPSRATRLANIIADGRSTLADGSPTFAPPLAGRGSLAAFPEYLFLATIEMACTSVVVRRA
jgi:hypothetical protein